MQNFDFLGAGLGLASPQPLCMVFQEYLTCYILLTDQISLSGRLYF